MNTPLNAIDGFPRASRSAGTYAVRHDDRLPRIAPRPAAHTGMRFYPVNSPQAQARLVAMALLVDGRLEMEELVALERHRAFVSIGLDRAGFFEVMFDLCEDIAGLPSGRGDYLLSAPQVARLLADVSSTAIRRRVARLLFDVIRADGRLSESEGKLFWMALDTWNLRLDALVATSDRPEYSRPETRRGD